MDDGGKIVFLIFMILIVSAILREIKKKTNIPFSPMLLVVGLIFGLFNKNLGFVGECVRLLNGIDPHSLLMIFIPGLVFEGSYNTDTYVFGKSKWQVLILAGPGVVMTSVALAFVLIYVLGYGSLGVSEALVIGSVIATTDPVAVVALLKELGASTRFRTMIEGESLLNDGTAFVFFLICMDVVKSGSLNYGSAVVQLIRLSLGGPAFGVVCGFVVTFWIKRIRKDSALISVIIIFTCYACFFVSENYLKVSGILAIVSLGIYMAGNMRVHLSHEIDHTVHSVWSFLGFTLESVIFILSGTFIGEKFFNWDQLSLNKNDIWKALVFQVILFLVRYVVNLVLLPFLNCTGYKTSLSNIFILSYGGLRGAIALSLAMLVATDTELNQEIRDVCLFYVVVTIVYSVCVSGMTIKTMMKWSGFLAFDPIKEKMTNGVMRKMILSTIREKDRMEHQDQLVGTDWEKVKQLAHLKRFEVLE